MLEGRWEQLRQRDCPRRSESVIEYIGRRHGIEAFEYQGRLGKGVLVSAGTGLMMSVMDQCRTLRWCLDVDLLSTEQRVRFPDWLACMNKVVDFVAVTGWFCATDPTPLARAVARVVGPRLRCYVQCHGKRRDAFDDLRTADTLRQMVEQVKALEAVLGGVDGDSPLGAMEVAGGAGKPRSRGKPAPTERPIGRDAVTDRQSGDAARGARARA